MRGLIQRLALGLAPALLPSIACFHAIAQQQAPLEVAPSWQCRDRRDPMTDEVQQFISLLSSNTVQLMAPYGGGSTATLTISLWSGRPQVSVLLHNGQMSCGYRGCQLRVRLDEGPVLYVAAEEIGRSAMEIKLLCGAEQQWLAAKRIRVELPVYQDGGTVFIFNPPPIETSCPTVARFRQVLARASCDTK